MKYREGLLSVIAGIECQAFVVLTSTSVRKSSLSCPSISFLSLAYQGVKLIWSESCRAGFPNRSVQTPVDSSLLLDYSA